MSRSTLVSSSVEDVSWIAAWCEKNGVRYHVEQKAYPTALVGDPVCSMRLDR